MQLYHIYLKTYKRQMNFAPPVNSVAWVECESLPQQKTDWLEFTYRMSMEKARIKTRLNGKNLELSSPHLLIKRPGDIIEHPEPVVLESYFRGWRIEHNFASLARAACRQLFAEIDGGPLQNHEIPRKISEVS